MPSPTHPDIPSAPVLAAPLGGGSPVGPRPQDSDAIQSAREELAMAYDKARDLLKAPGRIERPDWNALIAKGGRYLAETSRDLDVAAWTAEALVRQTGIPGVRDALQMLATLVTHHGPRLHPQPEPGRPERRFAGLRRLSGQLPASRLPLRTCPITTHGDQPLKLARWLQLQEGHDPAALEAAEDGAAKTSARQYADWTEDLSAAVAALDQLDQALTELPESKVEFDGLRGDLALLTDAVGSLARRGSNPEPSTPPTSPPTSARPHTAPLGDREQALAQLREVAAYFSRTEPQSPLSYTLERALRWSEIALPDLLNEVIADPEARAVAFRIIGIPATDQESS